MAIQLNKRRFSVVLRVPRFLIHLGVERRPYKPIIVVTNRTEDNRYVPFFDYDGIRYSQVLSDIKSLKNMGPSIVLSRKEDGFPIKGNYHIAALSKWPYHMIKDLQIQTRCDRGFIKKSEKRKHCALRVTAKGKDERPEFKEIISGKTNRQCSLAHYLMLRRLHNIPVLKLQFDRFTELTMAQDMTAG